MSEHDLIEYLKRYCGERASEETYATPILSQEYGKIRAYEDILTTIKVFEEQYRDRPSQIA